MKKRIYVVEYCTLIMILTGSILIGCSQRFHFAKWEVVEGFETQTFGVLMVMDPMSRSLWISGASSIVEEISLRSGPTPLYFGEANFSPSGEDIVVRLCVTDKLWAVMSNLDVVRYDSWNGNKTIYTQFESLLREGSRWPDCAVLGGELVLWYSNWIATFENNVWTFKMFPEFKSPINRITEDIEGNDWLILDDGTLYRRTGGGWKFVKNLDISLGGFSIFKISPKNIVWVGSNDLVYQWPMDAANPEEILDVSSREPIDLLDVFFDSNAAWIIASGGIWKYQNDAFYEIELPTVDFYGEKKHITVFSVAFDTNTGILYVTSGEEVYYFNTR